jgi:SpoIID/LytB domain protein
VRFPRIRALGALTLAVTLILSSLGSAVAPEPAFADPVFEITGRGWGHGVGLSQHGARGYASSPYNWGYARILSHYYQGTTTAVRPAATMRVNLAKNNTARGSWWVQSGNTGQQLVIAESGNNTNRLTLSGANSYWIVIKNNKVEVYANGSSAPTGSALRVFSSSVFVTSGSGGVRTNSATGMYDTFGLVWRGQILIDKITTTTARAINYVDLEYYLWGVVPSEMPSTWPANALRAQAVAARSYAYSEAWASGKTGAVVACSDAYQVYLGMNNERAATTAAVNDTAGQVVVYGNTLVKTYFSSASGGHTANSEDVWVTAYPYYKGVPDADTSSPYFSSWGDPIKHTGSGLATRLRSSSSTSSNTRPTPTIVLGLTLDRATSGHVRNVDILWSDGQTTRVRGSNFRTALGLRSTKFYVNAPTPQLPGSTRYEQNVEMLRYSGSWSSWANPGLSGGSYSHTQTGAAAFRFFGTRFAWVTARSAGSGMGRVTIERVSTSGVRETVTTSPVDLYSPAVAYQQRVFDSGALTPAYYEVRIEGTGSGAVGIDAIDVLGAMVLPGAFIHEQHSHLIGYAGPWTTWSDGRLSAGSYAWSDDPAAEAAFSFSGTRFRWVTATGPSMGTARVYVDGKLHKTVSLKSASTQFQRVVLDTGTIPTGTRTVRIEPVGDGPVGIDRLEVTGSMNPAPAPLSWTPHDQTSVHIAYAGNWTRWTDTNMYGGSHDWSHSSLASAGLAHTGTRFRWFATTAPTYGTADVYMNGTYTATVSLKSQTLAYRQLVYDSGTLPEATRVVTIVPRGDGPVSLDRFSVLGTLGSPPQLPEWRSAEQDSGAIGYAGTWTTWNNSELSKGSYAWSESSAARAVFRFSGTRARWVTVTGPKMGSASVYVNGVLQQTVSLKSSTLAYRRIVFDTGQLPEGTHEVAIVPVGDGPVGVDRVDVSGQFLAPLDAEGFKLIEQTHPALTYAGAWTTWANAALSGGSYVWANSTVAEASFAFTGTRARWVTVTGPSMGSARVYVNGALRSTISLKSAALTYQSVVFDTGMLHDTTHTVTIVPVGDGPVGVDRVEVLGEVDVP